MRIRLSRALPGEMREESCGSCGVPFQVESVVALATTDRRFGAGNVCPSCIEYLGKRNPNRFLTIEEYEAAKQRYPEPIWAPEEEEAHRVLGDANWIIRPY